MSNSEPPTPGAGNIMATSTPDDYSDQRQTNLASNIVEPISLVALLTIFLKRRLMLLVVPLTTGMASLLVSVASPSYTASSMIFPELSQGSQASQFAGVAAQLGFQLGPTGDGESIDFYSTLLQSRSLLERAATASYSFLQGRDTISATLVEIFNISSNDTTKALLRTVERLKGDIRVSTDQNSGVLLLETDAKWPKLAELLNRRLIDLLTSFNMNDRSTKAAQERQFVEERLVQAALELREAEDGLRLFLEQNREFQSSPHLLFQEARLHRRVTLREQVHSTLAEALEQVRIEEVRNTPVLTVIDPPEQSAERSGLLLPLILGIFVGVFFSTSIVIAVEYWSHQSALRPDQIDDLKRHLPKRARIFFK